MKRTSDDKSNNTDNKSDANETNHYWSKTRHHQ